MMQHVGVRAPEQSIGRAFKLARVWAAMLVAINRPTRVMRHGGPSAPARAPRPWKVPVACILGPSTKDPPAIASSSRASSFYSHSSLSRSTGRPPHRLLLFPDPPAPAPAPPRSSHCWIILLTSSAACQSAQCPAATSCRVRRVKYCSMPRASAGESTPSCVASTNNVGHSIVVFPSLHAISERCPGEGNGA